jgi:hypothetical protein
MPDARKAYISDGVNWLPLVSAVPDIAGYATTEYVDNEIDNIDALPSQTGNAGKYLTTSGTLASWQSVDALPSQTGNGGKYLTTSGSVASWAILDLASAINTASAAAVSAVVDSAPSNLNTLNELAAAINDDPSFSTTVTTALGNKLDTSTAASTYLTQTTANNTFATQTALNAINGESDQFILPSQIFG